MSDHRKRIQTIRVLLAGSLPINACPRYADILDEFEQTYQAKKIPNLKRRWLIQVLHSTRGLDTALVAFLNFHAVATRRSLGGYLTALEKHSSAGLAKKLPPAARVRYQKTIVDVRNRHMHDAGAYPSSVGEVQRLLGEMSDCLADVLAL